MANESNDGFVKPLPRKKKKKRKIDTAGKPPTVVAVSEKDYKWVKDTDRGEAVRFKIGRDCVLNGIDVPVSRLRIIRVIETSTLFAHIEEISRIFGFVEVCHPQSEQFRPIFFTPVSEQERSELKSAYEEKAKLEKEREKRDMRWSNPKPISVPDTMPIILLNHNDYVLFRQHIQMYQKEVQLHSAVRKVLTEGGERAELSGYILRRGGHFIASAKAFVDLHCTIQQQGELFAGSLIGKCGAAKEKLQIAKSRKGEAVDSMIENARNPKPNTTASPARPRVSIEPKSETTKLKDPPKPNSDYVRNHQTWHSPLNLSFDLASDKKIQLYSQKCHCSKCAGRFLYDPVINCTAKVSTKSGQTVPVTVQYCTGCGSFFMNYATYKSYDKKYGGLKFRCRVEAGDLAKLDKDSSFADDSFLSRNGYNVNASTPRSQRQAALARILDRGIASKYEVTEKISEFINLRKNNPHMTDAIDRWEEDIAFVAGYKIREQADVGKREFEQKGKITKGRR